MDFNENENSLSFYIKELNNIYDLTLRNKLENRQILSEKQNEDTVEYTSNSKNSRESFSQYKEKAFDYLIKAKSLNNIINRTWQNENLIQAQDVEEIVSKYEVDRQIRLSHLINLHRHYEINFEFIKDKLKTTEIKNGLDDQTNFYLENTLNEFIANENSSFLKTENYIGNSNKNILLYGATGTGKMNWIVSFLLKNRIFKLFENEGVCVFKRTRIFIIDFESYFDNMDLHLDTCLFEDLMKSLSLLENSKLLVILTNIEILFKRSLHETEIKIKDRLLCGLVNELVNVQNESRLFIVLSEKPWLLHPSLLFK